MTVAFSFCASRTNSGQVIIAKTALGHQLYALGIIPSPEIQLDSDVSNLLSDMMKDHGDTIATQYGGSEMVNNIDDYRRKTDWKSHWNTPNIAGAKITNTKRYMANNFFGKHHGSRSPPFVGSSA